MKPHDVSFGKMPVAPQHQSFARLLSMPYAAAFLLALTVHVGVSTAQTVPTIQSLSPDSATAGGPAFTLSVYGTGFTSGSIVRWNGSSLSTTFVSSNQLNALVASSLITTVASANVTVVNPGFTSAPATFTVLTPTGQIWTQLSTTGGPPSPRSGANAVFDPASSQMILFGGNNSLPLAYTLDDVWSLNTTTNSWTRLTPSGTLPPTRSGAAAVYDTTSARMMIFGGASYDPHVISSPCLNDVWVLSNAGNPTGTGWIQLNPVPGAAPAARIFSQAVYDPSSNRMIVFGGNNCFNPDSGGVFYNDVWILTNANGTSSSQSAWTQLPISGPAPSPRENFSAVYDQVSNKMIIFGGAGLSGLSNDVWVLSNANGSGDGPAVWTQLSTSGGPPPGRAAHTAVYDPVTNKMTVFGGTNNTTDLSDTWLLTNANGVGGTPTWIQLAPLGPIPPSRTEHTAVFAPGSNQMFVFGGTTAGGSILNDVWRLDGAGALQQTQRITFGPIPAHFVCDPPFGLSATATSGLAVQLTLTSGPATLSGNILTITGPGTVVITATQPGNTSYSAAPPVTQSFPVTQAAQSISFGPVPSLTYSASLAPVALSASSLSGLPIVFSVVAGPATLSGNTLSITGAGIVSVQASQSGNTCYAPANASESIVVAKGQQTITLAPIADHTYGDAPFPITVSSSAGLPVTLAASGPATLSGNTITLTGAGTVTIQATQAGNENYLPAPPVSAGFNVAKARQTITLSPISDHTFGDAPFSISASSSANLPVQLSVSGPATLSGSTITLTGAGTVTVQAAQAGNGSYVAAAPVTVSFNVAPSPQTITIAPIGNHTFCDAPFPISVSSTSGLPVALSISGPATLSGSTITITGIGTVTVQATQTDAANYVSATASVSFEVTKCQQTITLSAIPDQVLSANLTVPVQAAASSGLPVSISIVAGPARVSGNVITITSAGDVTIQASQSGNANYFAAPAVSETFHVILSSIPQISLSGVSSVANATDNLIPAITLNQGLPVAASVLMQLQFVSNAVNPADDPTIAFAGQAVNGDQRKVLVPIQAGQTSGLPAIQFSAGTTAGTITLTAALTDSSGTPLPGAAAVAQTIQIVRAAPQIVGPIRAVRTANGFQLTITGLSTPREVIGAVFDFSGASKDTVGTSELTEDLSSSFTAFYQSSASLTAGSTFVFTQPFTLQGNPTGITAVTVTLRNSIGASQPSTVTLP